MIFIIASLCSSIHLSHFAPSANLANEAGASRVLCQHCHKWLFFVEVANHERAISANTMFIPL